MKNIPWIPLVVGIGVLFPAKGAHAATYRVPADYPTIQAAIDASAAGDTILVADGTYTGNGNTNLDFNGKDLLVKSVNGARACILDCQNSGRGFTFHSGETAASYVSGFTIQNGSVDGGGGGIDIVGSAPTVSGCIFRHNTATFGGGMDVVGGNPLITNCLFSGNAASEYGFGGGLYMESSRPTLANCLFSGNTAVADGFGGAMDIVGSAPIVTNCTFAGNTTSNSGGGMDIESASAPVVTNCILWGNAAAGSGAGLYTDDAAGLTLAYSDVQDGFSGVGNLNADPLFFNALGGDLHLQPGSPCIDAASASALGLPAVDLDGNPRILNGLPDMGAYEFKPLNTFLQVPDVSAVLGKTVLLRAALRRYPDGVRLFGKTLTFAVDGTNIGTAATASNGIASLFYTVPAGLGPGNHTFNAAFAGDADYNAVGQAGTLVVSCNTLTQVANANGIGGRAVLLRALTRRYPDGLGESGKTVTFQIDGATVGTATTASSGAASLLYTLPASLGPGSHLLAASFPGDSNDAASAGKATLGVSDNTLLHVADTSGKAGRSVLLRALLRRYPDGADVSGKTLTFAVDGKTVGTAATASTGLAALNYTVPASLGPGSHTLTVSFAADGGYLASSGTAVLTINP